MKGAPQWGNQRLVGGREDLDIEFLLHSLPVFLSVSQIVPNAGLYTNRLNVGFCRTQNLFYVRVFHLRRDLITLGKVLVNCKIFTLIL